MAYDSLKSTLTLTYSTTGSTVTSFDDSFCDYDMELKVDVTDSNVHQLFGVFEKMLLGMGFSEKSIVKGACQLAFNDMRDTATMAEVAEEYDLDYNAMQAEAEEARIREEKFREAGRLRRLANEFAARPENQRRIATGE